MTQTEIWQLREIAEIEFMEQSTGMITRRTIAGNP
jgi:hypothetical protein